MCLFAAVVYLYCISIVGSIVYEASEWRSAM